MTDRELMQQALDVLEDIFGKNKVDVGIITALRERLAQPEQWEQLYTGMGNPFKRQEPVAWMTFTPDGEEDDVWYENPEGKLLEGGTYRPLYTAPPRTWQPLPDNTLEELLGLHCSTSGYMSEADAREFATDLGSRLKELNT
jgi:hypothetical protein